jgi:uncharacterized protein (DUF58 family)
MASFLIRLQRLIYRNRSITFSPAGTRFILLTLAVGVAAVNTGNNLLYLILGMMLSLIIVSGILSEQSLRSISVEWRFPDRIFALQPVPVEMRIKNGKRFLPSFSFRVDEGNDPARSVYVFKLSAGETITVPQLARFEKRGLQTLSPLTLRTTFPFGFFHKSLIRPQSQTVLVFPRILPMPPGLQAPRARAGQDHDERRRGFGTELHNLRDYTSADDARGIHWKASARESKLLVKEFEREEDGRLHLFLSHHIPKPPAPGGPPGEGRDNFERAVEIAAALARELFRRGQSVDLQILAPDGPLWETHRDPDAILKTLALIQPLPDTASGLLDSKIAALAGPAADGGRRILILPSPDPLWDKARRSFTDVLAADEPRFIEWAGEKTRSQGVRG